MKVTLIDYPEEKDWCGVKARALVTVGKNSKTPPTDEWKEKILNARHSPIRYLRFGFLLEDVPSYVATHFARHVHAQPYIRSQRNDRQDSYDRNAARQDAPVTMIYDVNAEELMVVANKRLCNQADATTREMMRMMRDAVVEACPEFEPFLVPACKYNGVCHEMFPCNRK